MNHIIIPLNAFETTNSQHTMIGRIYEQQVHGVEIRRELMKKVDQEIELIAEELKRYPLFTVYSAPIELWKESGELNKQELKSILEEAVSLGAQWVKVSLGFYQPQSPIGELQELLQAFPALHLFVENDQTNYGGNIASLHAFFDNAYEIPVSMTFDIGNWLYVQERPQEAIKKLRSFVGYIHIKHVIKNSGKLVTTSISNDSNEMWKDILKGFSHSIFKALEFPIDEPEQIPRFISLVQAAEQEEVQ
ncbi:MULTISPECIES: sugar phosphate isomerase/epimerase family protein [Priestia]|uniref:sugar phosphate isomerase/epimerase family protein n=1 Tax=Priestia TaxID=2800373 RepID=UPI0025A3BAA8|nr:MULTISPECIES: sugar phosphate isomerase/epimerase [Priestia]MEB4886835.1 sugar phosphate isomerase/epimerase [Priestia megaterium]WJN42823.1 sugar phosphate isomerase/epimerase [Priestia aryabhattai]